MGQLEFITVYMFYICGTPIFFVLLSKMALIHHKQPDFPNTWKYNWHIFFIKSIFIVSIGDSKSIEVHSPCPKHTWYGWSYALSNFFCLLLLTFILIHPSGKAYNGNAAWLLSVIDSYPKLPPITCIPQLPVITVFGEVPHRILGNSARITFQLFLISYVLDTYLAAIHPLFIHISYSIQWHQK